MQRNRDTFPSACDVFGLTISTKKTEVMSQPAPHTNYSDPTITVKGQNLQTVDKFTYLDSPLSTNVFIDDEVDARIDKATTAFGRRRTNVRERQGLDLQTKPKVYKAVVMTTLLHACETWTVYCSYARKLNILHVNWLRRLLRITWQDMIPDTKVFKRAWLQSIHALLTKTQLRWTGHFVGMSDERLPKRLPYGELSEGRRSTSGQR